MDEPRPSDGVRGRYSRRPFPAYRHLPGRTPHPRRSPDGHSYGSPEPPPRPAPDCIEGSEDYRYAVDLYNFEYWWESHEWFEAYWRGSPAAEDRSMFQGLVQVAAAQLKARSGVTGGARRLLTRAIGHLDAVGGPRHGIDVPAFVAALRRCQASGGPEPVPLQLEAAHTERRA